MINIKKCFFIVIMLHFFMTVVSLKDEKNLCSGKISKVAIVGAGIGGAATAFFLSELTNKNEICVDIYEANKVGGRLSEVGINGTKFDSGGSVIHGSNLYLKYFMDKLDCKKRIRNPPEKFGFYNGKEFTFIGSSWTIVSCLKLLWRYGFGFAHIPGYVNKLIHSFNRIYDYQKEMKTFNDVECLLQIMKKDSSYLTVTLKNALLKEGFSELLIDEIVTAGLICNYGQGTNVHQFVGTVSMAGMDSSLWAVEGGQSQIVKGLVKKSGANLIHARVKEIHLNADSSFSLMTENISTLYDFIVIAAPLTDDSFPIVFKQFPNIIHVPGRYHRTVATILHGKLNYTYFGFANEKDAPNFIANVGNSFFNSVNKIAQVKSTKTPMSNIWKIFSPQPLTEEQLQNLFYEKSNVQVVDWLAYPHYDTNKRKDTFILHKNLFYLNAVEWVASAMEMSSISAKNIALLIVNHLFPERILKSQKVDVHSDL